MSDKSYVTMGLCPICKKENGTILMDKRIRPVFERHTMTAEPCDKCRKKYLAKGTLLICPDSGDLIVVKDTAFKKIFNASIPKGKIAACSQEVIDKLNPK